MDDIARVWDEAAGRLQTQIAPASFRMWFADARPVRLDGDGFELAVRSTFVRSWIEERLLGNVSAALAEVLNAEVPVTISVRAAADADDEIDTEEQFPVAHGERTTAGDDRRGPASEEAGLSPRFTFERFIIGESNRFAHATALAVAERPAEAYNPLFIHGGVGLGKTHLLHAIGHFVLEHFPDRAVRYVTIEQFTNHFIDAIRDKRTESFKRRYRGVDVLLIDDIQYLQGRGRTEEEFFHTFNALHGAGKQIVISSDRPARDFDFEDRLKSRFEWGLLTDVRPPDLETRIAILRKKVELEGIDGIDREVLSFVASGISNNVRELEGALTKLVAWASLNRLPVTVGLAREVLADALASPVEQQVSIETIIDAVCRYFAVSAYDLRSDKRQTRIVRPRQIAMYLCRRLTVSSYPAIGQRFGGRDHTTAMHADRKIKGLLATDREVFEQVEELTRTIRTATQ